MVACKEREKIAGTIVGPGERHLLCPLLPACPLCMYVNG